MNDGIVVVIGVAIVSGGLLFAQQPLERRDFDVASIKLSPPPYDRISMRPGSPGTLNYRNVSLLECIAKAYDLQNYQVIGPKWASEERYLIMTKAPAETKEREMMEMLQNLLADRFNVAVHFDTSIMPVYALVLANHDHLRVSSDADQPGLKPAGNGWSAKHVSMSDFARFLSSSLLHLDRPVIDKTGLTNFFDFELEYLTTKGTLGAAEASSPEDNNPVITTAIREQLGLKLVASKSPVRVLVIDRCDRPTAN
jgi:uncharacterized protein (TIGR03435 family)